VVPIRTIATPCVPQSWYRLHAGNFN